MEAEPRIDLRFAEIPFEFMVVSEYLALVESNLPSIVAAEKQRAWQGRSPADDEDAQLGNALEQMIEDGVTTRFLTGAAVMALWAIYETSVKKLAAYLQGERRLGMSGLRGGFLQQARTYFEDVLKVPLHPNGTDWSRLAQLYAIRNILAHTNGSLDDQPETKRNEVQAWVAASNGGLTIADYESLVISLSFAKDALQFVRGLVQEVVERVKDATPEGA